MKEFRRTMFVSIAVNTVLVLIKFTMGLISNYKSLVADALHSFSDLSTDIIAIFGEWLSNKKADKSHPYGHGKIEYITSIIIGTFIMILGINMLYSAIDGSIVESRYRLIALIAVIVTIILKYCLSRYVYLQGKRSNNSILIAGSKENMSDVLSASGVFIAIILSFFKEDIIIFRYADKVAGFVISLLILRTAFNILKTNINTVIGECEQDEEIIYRLKGIIMSIPEVLSIDNLIVMKFGSYYQVTLDAGVDAECKFEEAHTIAHNIEHELLESDIKTRYVAVHVNPYKK